MNVWDDIEVWASTPIQHSYPEFSDPLEHGEPLLEQPPSWRPLFPLSSFSFSVENSRGYHRIYNHGWYYSCSPPSTQFVSRWISAVRHQIGLRWWCAATLRLYNATAENVIVQQYFFLLSVPLFYSIQPWSTCNRCRFFFYCTWKIATQIFQH